MLLEQMCQAGERVITQVFVIYRVVLQRFDQRQQVVRFVDENSIVVQQLQNILDDAVDIIDVCEAVGRCDDLGSAVFTDNLGDGLLIKEGNQSWDIPIVGKITSIRWLIERSHGFREIDATGS